MTEKVVKPIPKYILAKIKRLDKSYYPSPCGQSRFYAYLTKAQGELVKVTVAVKHHKKQWYCKPVAWHGVHSDKCYLKDIGYTYIGGFSVGWYDEGLQSCQKWFEYGIYHADDKYYDPYAPIINPEFIDKFPEYKYSAYSHFSGVDLLKYLRLYEQYPQLEMLMKLGFEKIAMSKTILKRCGTDKTFCKWLIANKSLLQSKHYYIDVIVQAYKMKTSLDRLQAYKEAKLKLIHDTSLSPIKEMFKGKDLERFFDYIAAKRTDPHSYLDYLKACNHLGLDMTEDKNRFPHDFKRWHDIRIDQYATARAEADRKAKQTLYEQFAAVAEKYMSLQYDKRGTFICIIAHSPADLIREGEMLHHCVGRMNYDQRFIREESLIFFIRARERPDVPFVTVEYSLKSHKVLQCYGDTDTKPSDNVLSYVHKIWLPYANKHLKQIQNAL